MRSLKEIMASASDLFKDIRVPERGCYGDYGRAGAPGDGGADLSGLYEPMIYALSAGGKRLRPTLCLMACEAFGQVTMERAFQAAKGLEMFHNFTLLHDDVMDNSDTRRGRPTVHIQWDVNTAILSGDAMLTMATELVSEVDNKILRPVLDCFNRNAMYVYEGQQLDTDFEDRDFVAPDEYIEMVKGKTGALLGASCKIGALIGGATETQAEAMYDFGMNLGVAFQIEDDYLDVYGDAKTFGKPIGGDIRNAKKTFLLSKGMSGESADSQLLAQSIKNPDLDARCREVTEIYSRMGMPEICRCESEHWTSKALDSLKRARLSDEAMAEFRALASYLVGRSV